MNKTVAQTASPRLFSLNDLLLKALAGFPWRVLLSCLLMFLMFHQPLLVLAAATNKREESRSAAQVVERQILSNQAKINESRANNVMADAPPPVAATLALTPAEVGPNVTGTTQALSATLRDAANNPLSGKQVTFTVTGANPTTATATTSVNGIAIFNLNGAASSVDTIRASAADGAATILSNSSTVTWITPAQAISTTTVLGRFFNGTTTGGYEVPAGQQPLFTQQFPTVNFNPAPNTIINQPADVNPNTRPMVNVTTDTAGNYTGKIAVEGNGYQAGKVGSLMPVAATFSANFNVAAAGNVTFNFYSDDGFYLGIGNGATRVGGVNDSIPASGRTAYLNLPIMGGYNKKTAPIANSITVNFPVPGTYPYEIDWADCCMTQEALTMTTSLTGRSVPPAGSIVLTPGTTTPKPTGQAQTFTATVTNAAGAIIPNQAVTFKVTGANARQINATTNATGQATLTYAGTIAGADQIQVTGQITGMPMFSNAVQQQWQVPVNQPPVANFTTPDKGSFIPLNVISHTSNSGGTSNAPENLLDGVNNTYWRSASSQTTEQSFVFEVRDTNPQIINRVLLNNYNWTLAAKDFEIFVSTTSTSSSEFRRVLAATFLNNNVNSQTFSFPDTPARYIKLVLHNNYGATDSMALCNFDVLGSGSAASVISLPGQTNVALAQSPALLQNGGGVYSFGNLYGNADGDVDSRPTQILDYDVIDGTAYQTNGTNNQFVIVRLAKGKSYPIRGVRVASRYYDLRNGTYLKDFEIWVSNTTPDEAAFTKVLTAVSPNNTSPNEYLFPDGAVQARYVKYVPKSGYDLTKTSIGTGIFDVLPEIGARVLAVTSTLDTSGGASAIFDGSERTYWQSASNNTINQSVKIALKDDQVHELSKVRILPMWGYCGHYTCSKGPKDYDIRVSTTTADDNAFTTVYSGTLPTPVGWQDINFANFVQAKYVQFLWKNGQDTSIIGVSEIEAHAVPSQGAILIGSSSQAADYQTAIQALDIDPTNWSWNTASGQNTDQWLKLRLSKPGLWTINQVALYPNQYDSYGRLISPKDFEVQISTTNELDSSFSTTFAGTLLNKDELQYFYFPPVQARYVRLLLKNNYGGPQIGLRTFHVFAADAGDLNAQFFDLSLDSDGQIAFYQWSFGDGSISTERNPTHRYDSPGIYNVRLTVTDNSGATAQFEKPYRAILSTEDEFDFAVSPMIVRENTETVSFLDVSPLLSFKNSFRFWDFGNGENFTQYAPNALRIFKDNGNFQVKLKIGSDRYLNYTINRPVTVLNRPPKVVIENGKNVYWGETWSNQPTISDPSPIDNLTLRGRWDFGDTESAECTNCTNATAKATHSYARPGSYNAALTITDKDGGVGSASTTYTVNKRPTAFVFQQPIRNGNQLTLRAELRDTFGNLPLASKPVQIVLNGTSFNATTNSSGTTEFTVPFASGTNFGLATASFAGDEFYASSQNAFLPNPNPEPSANETISHSGMDFWLTYPGNANVFCGGFGSCGARAPILNLYLTASVDTTGTVSIPGLSFTSSFTIAANTVTTVTLPAQASLDVSNIIENKGIHVVSQNPITVYAMNQIIYTSDAYLGLPTPTLGKEYLVLSYPNNTNNFAPGSQFAVLATQDATTVTITPTMTTDGRQAGVPFTLTLNQGQTYLLRHILPGANSDVSGSLIVSDKPVAVFAGQRSVPIPDGKGYNDHLVEQLPPLSTWGKRFATVPLATRQNGDTFRFLAGYNDTAIYLNGAFLTTLNRGQVYETIVRGAAHIIATEPILAAQYANGSRYDNTVSDPMMMVIPPASQFLSNYTITTPASGFSVNYVNVVAPTERIGTVKLDGTVVPTASFTPIGNSGYSGAQIALPIGTHRLEANTSFGIFVYGFSTDEGYGYPGGMNLRPSVRGAALTLAPETAARSVNTQGCVTATLKDQDGNPLGGRAVSFTVTGVNPNTASKQTDAAGTAEYCYIGAGAGSDNVRAEASTNVGNASTTATIVWTAPNQAPIVSAGPDRTVVLPATAALAGTATDDGLPTGSTLVRTWSKVSGVGTVTFANPSQAATTASFSAAGVYVLRLTASDGVLSASDEMTVTVSAQPANQAPTANAGADQTVSLNANLVRNPSAEAAPVSGEVPNWTEVTGTTWTRASSATSGFPLARLGGFYLYPGAAATAELRQDVDVQAFAAGITAQTQSFAWRAFSRSQPEAVPDNGRIIIEYRNAANSAALGSLDSGVITSTAAWNLTEDTRVPPVGTAFIRIRLLATRNTGTTNDVFFDAMSLRAVGTVAAVKLAGTRTDDGLPTGSTLSSVWTKVAGAGTVAFSNPNSATSAATFNAVGTYTLRLTATDGTLSTSDDVIVTVGAANTAPVINAGTDRAVTLPATATLAGTATDDGRPTGSTVSQRWTKISGAGTVAFSNATALNPTVTFGSAGTYVLRLTADDGELESTDDISITVNAAPTNQPPVVNAGANQTIALPTNSATLTGTATDDGLPTGGTLTRIWSKTSGAGTVTFANPNSAATTVTLSAVGNYVLRLTVSDGQYTVWDEMAVVVNPANIAPTTNAGADQTITLAQQAALIGAATDDGLPSGNLTAAWSKVSGTGTVTFSLPNNLSTFASFSQTGTYTLRLTVSDGALSASDTVVVKVDANVPAPTVDILTPTDGAGISTATAITGNVSGGNWKLESALSTEDNESNLEWTQLASGTGAVANQTLGTLDPTLLLNGTYALRLTAIDSYGQYSWDTTSVVVSGNVKVGHFTVSFEDLNVPVAGIPISVVRTYDSRDKRTGDFGAGWALGLKSVRVEKNGVLGLRWYQTATATAFPTYCVQATRPHIVTVTMPDGAVEKFEAKLQTECQQLAPISSGNLIFAGQAGATGKLETVGDNRVTVAGSVPGPVQLIGLGGGVDIFNTTLFRYTSKDGTQFIVDQRSGLQSLTDTNNNTLTVSASGIVHSSGKSIAFTRDAQNRITAITDPLGNVQTYTYDAAGDLRQYKDRENNITKYDYEPTIPHHLKTITDALNRQVIRNEYDASGRLTKHIDAEGREILYTHDLATRVEIVKDRLNYETRFEYDERGNVLKKTDAKLGVTSFSYDANDNVLTETNAVGKTTTYTYDGFDNRTSVKDALNNLTTFTYNGLGRVLTVTDARGKTTANTYDTAGNLLTSTDPDGKVTTNTYSISDGSLTSTKDALNNTTAYQIINGLLVKETDALGRIATFTYDQNGNRKTETRTRTNGQGLSETLTTTYEYDRMNRLVRTIYPNATFTTVEYSALGQQTASVDQLNRRTEMEYDDQGRLVKTIYPDGKFDESIYDAEGRRLTSKDRSGKITSFTYDELGRLTKTTAPDATFTETVYDAAGQVTTSKDARGNLTTFTYDDAGRRTSVKNALNQITAFTFDANGNQLTVKDATNNTVTSTYDNLNRRTRTTFPGGSFVQTTYDAIGRRTAERDQANKITQFEYDKLGRLTKVKDALLQETTYSYDELGQQISQKDANLHETKFEYDSLGRRIKRTLPGNQAETYSYFDDGALQSKTDFNGKTTTFAYDNMRRLLTKTPDASFGQSAVSFTYNDLGQCATMTDASGVSNYVYDARNRLASKQTPNGTLTYTYDASGNLKTARSSNAGGTTVDYTYDQLNRLKTVKDNRLVTNQTTTYNYDAAGNLLNYVYPNAVTTAYTYNSLNRLTNIAVLRWS